MCIRDSDWSRTGDAAGPTLEFLGPPTLPDPDATGKLGDNDLSLVASLRWRGRHILLPGDVEGLGLESLLKWEIEKVDVLVAAHHGSKHSKPNRFARWCEPDYVFVSCGARRFSQQDADEFKRGHPCDVFTTDQSGAVRCVIGSDGELTVKHWNGGQWALLNHL